MFLWSAVFTWMEFAFCKNNLGMCHVFMYLSGNWEFGDSATWSIYSKLLRVPQPDSYSFFFFYIFTFLIFSSGAALRDAREALETKSKSFLLFLQRTGTHQLVHGFYPLFSLILLENTFRKRKEVKFWIERLIINSGEELLWRDSASSLATLGKVPRLAL